MASTRAPGPRGLDRLRAIRDFVRDPLDYLVRLRRYGDVVRTAAGPIVFHTFYDPRGIRHVFVDHPHRFTKRGVLDDLLPVLGDGLIASEGSTWRAHRSALSPGMTRRAMAGLAASMDETVGAVVGRWRPGDVIDATEAMSHLALRVVGRTLFGVDLDDRVVEVSAAVEQVSRLAIRRSRSLPKLPLAVPTPANLAYRRSIRVLRRLVDSIIAEAGTRAAFMQQLHDATDPDQDALRDQVMTFVLAGHETTASTLAWTLAHLCRDHALQTRARAEAGAVLAGGSPGAGGLDRLPLIDAIVSEALRLYPPGWMLMRRAEVADEILGCAVPRGSFVIAPIHALHRHPDHWTDPGRFDPDRFVAGRVPADAMLYMPFGAGPRRCIGEAFARMETRLLLARLLERFGLEPAGDLPRPLPLSTLRPAGPVRVRLVASRPEARPARRSGAAAPGSGGTRGSSG